MSKIDLEIVYYDSLKKILLGLPEKNTNPKSYVFGQLEVELIDEDQILEAIGHLLKTKNFEDDVAQWFDERVLHMICDILTDGDLETMRVTHDRELYLTTLKRQNSAIAGVLKEALLNEYKHIIFKDLEKALEEFVWEYYPESAKHLAQSGEKNG